MTIYSQTFGNEVVSLDIPEGASDGQIRAAFALEMSKRGFRNPSAARVIHDPSAGASPDDRPTSAGVPGATAGQGTLSAAEGNWRDNLAQGLSRLAGMYGGSERRAYDFVKKGLGFADYLPGVGDAASAADTADAAGKGNWGEAAVNGVATGLGLFPVVGDAAGAATKAMFLGIGAKNADLEAFRTAKDMKEAGASPEEIRQRTNWFQAPDTKWRFEIDDSSMQIRNPLATSLGTAADHPELFANYPDMAGIPYKIEEGMGASYHQPYEDFPEEMYVGVGLLQDPEKLRKALAHEMQHGVQYRERFAAGSSPANSPKVYEGSHVAEANENIRRARLGLRALETNGYSFSHSQVRRLQQLLEEWRERREMMASYEGYQRAAGEVEARNVENRLDYDRTRRAAISPSETADRPPEQQWFPRWVR